ncbi:uncharacterized protein LOC120909293 [Rana temporaria]|uniref:uncharacterized protein LOC120909293 n=1 Tax=Rana temporaria TaxID=8407 RepID=UPI001AACC191|nr:uncharacterized protein LOC120909293 [Rana temporaria]
MSSQVNQQFEMQASNQMDPSLYECISPSEHPLYSSNVPSANPAWNICNGAPITSMKSQQWNIYSAATIPSMAQSQNVLPGSVMPHLKCKPKVMGIQGSLCLSILICVFSVAGLSLNIVDYLAYNCYSSHSYYCSSLIVGSQVHRGLYILTYLLQFAVSVIPVFAFRVQEHSNSTPPPQIQGFLYLSILICVFSVVGLSLNFVDYLDYYYCHGSHSYYCSNLIVGSQVLRGLFILTHLLQFAASVSIYVSAFRVQEPSNPTPPIQVFVIQIGGEVLQASPVPGSYPTYPSKQPPPYVTKSVMGGGPTAYQNPSS